MSKLLILLVLLAQTHAQQGTRSIETCLSDLDKINRPTQATCSSASPPSFGPLPSVPSPPFDECLKDLCQITLSPPSTEYQNAQPLYSQPRLSPEQQKALGELQNLFAKLRKANEETDLVDIPKHNSKSLLKEGRNLPLTDARRKEIAATQIGFAALTSFRTGATGALQLNSDQLAEYNWKPEQIGLVERLLKTANEQTLRSINFNLARTNPTEFLKLRYPGKALKEGLSQYIEEIEAAREHLQKKDPLGAFKETANIPTFRLKVQIANDQIQPEDYAQLINRSEYLFLLNSVLSQPIPPALINDEQIKRNIEQNWTRSQTPANRRENEIESQYEKIELQVAEQGCAQVLTIGMQNMPSHEKLNQLEQNLNRAKNLAENHLKREYSAESARQLISQIQEITFTRPPTEDGFKASILGLVTDEIEQEHSRANWIKELMNNNSSSLLQQFLALPVKEDAPDPNSLNNRLLQYDLELANSNRPTLERQQMLSLKMAEEAQRSSSLLRSCRSIQQSNPDFGDYSMDFFNQIKISPSTANFPADQQMGIILHEMGHQVSRHLGQPSMGISAKSRGTYLKTRKCLNRYHTSSEQSVPMQFAEEDFADLFATHSLNSPKSNWTCSLIPILEKNLRARNLGAIAETQNDFKHPSHSSVIFRVLMTELTNGRELPKSCKRGLNQLNQSMPEPCDLTMSAE